FQRVLAVRRCPEARELLPLPSSTPAGGEPSSAPADGDAR
ncbi:MAG: CDP-alcohol phosphatidyltransferase family protein, partial [Rhodococcus sp. (in: high G+C Gram-positive bacteria)]|nr:CDP-alcohol phosphatidyltransferase family protein [Rhodococcus sp. (in: high G+C Gram-positive bacteria)]MDX5453780.1 CDP-alcohol phosphatidyltransferase family protein [Rhodococcus sp. (in: high G+C Gram-positive bacteria)]